MPLTVREALAVATAASVAKITNARGKLKEDHVDHDHALTDSKHPLLWR